MARKIQKVNNFSSNEILTAITILAVLKHCNSLEITKVLLIEPICSYKKLLTKLANNVILMRSIEELIIKSDFILTNFNKKFEESLILSLNAIYLLIQLKLIIMENNCIQYNGELFNFDEKSIGTKAKMRIKASNKLSNLIQRTNGNELYLHLRVEL